MSLTARAELSSQQAVESAVPPAEAPPLAWTSRPDEQSLIISMKLGPEVLHEGMIAYVEGEQVFLPLLEIVAGLNLPIEITPENGYAAGWFREESNRFVLDVPQQRLSIGGQMVNTDWSRVELHEYDIYVESRLLKQWFELEFDVLLNALLVRLAPDQWLPLEQRLNRYREWERIAEQQPIQLGNETQWLGNPGRWAGWPALDNNLRLSLRGRETGRELLYQYDLLAAGDLLKLNALYSMNLGRTATDDLSFAARLQLENQREKPEDWRLVVGDFTAPSLPLVTQQQEGVGLMVSNFSQEQSAEFDRIGLRGDALNGWDVEVYRNNQLIAFQTVDESNRYEFNNIPVEFGLNLFRLVFYGPEGQRRERVEQFVVGEDMVPQGEAQWLFAANFNNRRLLPGQREFILNTAQGEALTDSLQAVTAFRYGLSRAWSVESSLSTLRADTDQRRHYWNVSLRTGQAGTLYDANVTADNTGGLAARLSAQVLGGDQNWQAEYGYFRDYVSPLLGSGELGDALQHRVQLRWNGELGAGSEPLALESRWEHFNSGRDVWRNTLRYSQRYRGVNLATSLAHGLRETGSNRLGGAALLSYRNGDLNLNGQLAYELAPRAALQSANLTATWRASERVTLRSNLRKAFAGDTDDRLNLNVAFKLTRWIISMSADYNFKQDYGLNLNFFSSLSRSHDGWRLANRSRISTATITAQVFLDHNSNQRFDAGDEPLPEVRFRVNSAHNRNRTDEHGMAVIPDMPTNIPINVSLVEGSLRDPYWLPLSDGYRIHLRPGQSHHLTFPIAQSAEVDGTVWIAQDGEAKPAANVQIQLLDMNDQVLRETKSAYDGFYLLDQIIPGDYQLRVSQQQLVRLGLDVDRDYRLMLSANGDVQSGLDFSLSPQENTGP